MIATRSAIPAREQVVLTDDLPGEGLRAGDVGVIVFVHGQGEAYEVEFVTLSGATVAVATARAEQVRPLDQADMCHARPLATVDYEWPQNPGRATVEAGRGLFDQVWNSPEEDEAWRDL